MKNGTSATRLDRLVSASLVGELRQLSHDLQVIGVESVKVKHPGLLWEAARRIENMEGVLRQMLEADLHDGNCASLDVATRRIRSLARRGLS